jgi:hypothetical protein
MKSKTWILYIAISGAFGFIPLASDMQINDFTFFSTIFGLLWTLIWILVWIFYRKK